MGKRALSLNAFFSRAMATELPHKGAMNVTKNLGMLLLAIYLILAGITLLLPYHYSHDRDGDPGAGGRHFDSHRQIAPGGGTVRERRLHARSAKRRY